MSITIRTATLADVEALAALNRAAYPDLVEDGVGFGASTTCASTRCGFHLAGQLVAERDGRLRRRAQPHGSFSRARSTRWRRHTWMGVTDAGSFERHDPSGDTLYLADIYVDQAAWGAGVGRAAVRRALRASAVVALASTNVVGGGRLYDFVDAPATLTPQAYVAAVISGERRDRVLISQLRAGFEVRGLLPGYLHDWRSRHCATLIVWWNPERANTRVARASGMADAARDWVTGAR